VFKWFSVVPVEINRPKIYEIKSAFHRALFQDLQFFARHFGERWEKFCQLDVNVRPAFDLPINRLGLSSP